MPKQSIFFRQSGVLKRLFTDDIVIMEANDNYVKIFSDEGVFTVRTTLDAALSRLPANKFLRVTRTYAVGIEHIDSISKELLKIKGVKNEVPVSKQYYREIIKQITILDPTPLEVEIQNAVAKKPRSKNRI
jgi:DNA-binding LytR/AlgR family response regulator